MTGQLVDTGGHRRQRVAAPLTQRARIAGLNSNLWMNFDLWITLKMSISNGMARMSVMATLTFRNRDGELIDVPTVAATRFKNEFGSIFEQAALGGAVAITKHNTPKAVLLSYAEFEALTKASMPALDELSGQFDQLLERMQTQRSKSAMASAFDATPEQLGRAAVKAAKR
jgi:prevent-host-death family protein